MHSEMDSSRLSPVVLCSFGDSPCDIRRHPENIPAVGAIDAERSQKLSSDLGISECELVCEAQSRLSSYDHNCATHL
jgi:hypothetical protein